MFTCHPQSPALLLRGINKNEIMANDIEIRFSDVKVKKFIKLAYGFVLTMRLI